MLRFSGCILEASVTWFREGGFPSVFLLQTKHFPLGCGYTASASLFALSSGVSSRVPGLDQATYPFPIKRQIYSGLNFPHHTPSVFTMPSL